MPYIPQDDLSTKKSYILNRNIPNTRPTITGPANPKLINDSATAEKPNPPPCEAISGKYSFANHIVGASGLIPGYIADGTKYIIDNTYVQPH
ncbi:MAG: hypothetical protein Rubg2KO_04100 [Rubricoccaceae bacterium]